jgi:hypothetical protein
MKWRGNWLTTFVSDCTYLTINALEARTKDPLFFYTVVPTFKITTYEPKRFKKTKRSYY